MPRRLDLASLRDGVLAGDRAVLARAITLVESRRADDRKQAQALLAELLPHTGGAHRIGVTGVPGVGKSTFLEALGVMLANGTSRVAVLAVDPSSGVSGGSILGDKSRMARLAQHDRAYVRPSPSARSLGGVARRTRETMLLCEAASFDVVFVETVGVGQSETMVADMVDCFLLLMLPGGGDELQGIKRGIMEMADIVAINKADGDNLPRARDAKRAYSAALRYLRPRTPGWTPSAMLVSALHGDGLDALWDEVKAHRAHCFDAGVFHQRRSEQLTRWMWNLVEEGLQAAFVAHPAVAAALPTVEAAVAAGERPPTEAAESLLAAFGAALDGSH